VQSKLFADLLKKLWSFWKKNGLALNRLSRFLQLSEGLIFQKDIDRLIKVGGTEYNDCNALVSRKDSKLVTGFQGLKGLLFCVRLYLGL
jgi:hypothetical protein